MDRASVKQLTGTKVVKGKRIPRNIGKIREVVFFPDRKRVAGFITKRSDFLLMFKRRGHFISIDGYYLYEGLAFARPQKGSLDDAAYDALGLEPENCVQWLGLPVVTEDGQSVGVVSDVSFIHMNGEVESIKVTPGSLGKLLQGSRTIPTDLIEGFRKDVGTTLALAEKHKESDTGVEAGGGRSKAASRDEAADSSDEASCPPTAILVSNEALDIEIEDGVVSKAGKRVSEMASNAGVDTAAVSEKARSAAGVAGEVAKGAAVATGKQLKKTKGMLSAFKEEYDKARKS